nr:hypothetical protein [Streptomyces sp.]
MVAKVKVIVKSHDVDFCAYIFLYLTYQIKFMSELIEAKPLMPQGFTGRIAGLSNEFRQRGFRAYREA